MNLFLGKGEASVIALCLENADSLLIIDEKKGRRIAKDLEQIKIGLTGGFGAADFSRLILEPIAA